MIKLFQSWAIEKSYFDSRPVPNLIYDLTNVFPGIKVIRHYDKIHFPAIINIKSNS